MKLRVTFGAMALVLVAGAGAWVAAGGCSTDPTVAQPHLKRDLKAEEIRTMLTSGNFKQKLEAKDQIDKLEPEERMRVLTALSTDSDAAVRLIAVQKLKKSDDPRAKDILAKLAKDDPDDTVRDLAKP